MIGGAEQSTLLLARTLSALGHQVDVLCTTGRRGRQNPRTRSVDGIDGRIFEGSSDGLLDLYPREEGAAGLLRKGLHHFKSVHSGRWERWLRGHLAANSYDLLHSNNLAGMGDAPWRAAAAAGLPVLHTLRDYALLCPRTTLWRSRGEECERAPIPCRVLRGQKMAGSDAVSFWVAASGFVLQRHDELGSLGAAPQEVIPNAYPGEFPESFQLPQSEPFRLLYMGQLEEHKGLRLCMRALEFLWADGSEVECTIAGSGSLAHEVAAFVNASGGRCHYIGHVAGAEKQRALLDASALVFPSLWREPFGLGVVEGFAYGRPVIACTGSGGPEELIREGSDGRLVAPTVEALAAAVRDYLESGDVLRAHAEAAWQRRDEFRAENMARRYLAAYERVAAI
jgi:glycosyltransferase involved in cell wall biosynthesis